MNVAIIGAGQIAHTHAEALQASGIHIELVVDATLSVAKAFAEKYNIPRYGTDIEMVYTDQIQVVHVCAPPNLHYKMVSRLIKAGKHVLCEKPLCFEDDQAEELASLAKEYGVVCATNFNVRFHMACQKARQLVDSEEFGRVLLVHGNYLQEFHALPAPNGWRYDYALSGRMRAVTEIGTHWFDIAQYISGKKIKAVSAQFVNCTPIRHVKDGMMYPPDVEGEALVVDSEDIASINIRYEDGVIGSVLLSEISPGRVNDINLEVTGEKGNVWWNSESYNILHNATKNSGVHTEIFAFGNGFMDTFRELVNHFYAAVREGKEPEHPVYPTFEEAANVVKICNAVLRSADNDAAWEEIE